MFKQKSILKYELISTIFIMISGVLLHFAFKWSGNNVFVGIFTPINESIWEHLKLVFFPMTISAIIGYFYEGKNIDNYLWAKIQGTILAMIFIVIFFYTYTGIIGKNIDFINIGSYFLAIILGQSYAITKIKKDKENIDLKYVIFIFVILCLSFFVFTFSPPQINLFKDPVTSAFGI